MLQFITFMTFKLKYVYDVSVYNVYRLRILNSKHVNILSFYTFLKYKISKNMPFFSFQDRSLIC